ncbi:uncharacterized protein LOC129050933 isoform X5 [Pongo abelii]|uniref:uncharacterized protein LOC129050933 isoform X5 n=1 Tax=Pongo abelii TaxID=9601 RepID=UPI0023E8405C|nr:uncharacterized protein LOC129050933 isoform X9 [Pongo abelii]
MACRHFFPLKDGGIERQLPWLWNVSLGNRCETDKVCRTSRLSITPAPAPALLTPAWVPQPLHLWILSGYKVLAAFLQERMDHLPTKPPALEPSSQIPLSVEAKSDAQRTHQVPRGLCTHRVPSPNSSMRPGCKLGLLFLQLLPLPAQPCNRNRKPMWRMPTPRWRPSF